MKRSFGLIFMTAITILVGFTVLAQQEEAEVQNVKDTFVEAFNHGDTEALAEIFAEDALFFAPNREDVQGREAIRATFEAMMAMGISEVRLDVLEVRSQGETAYGVGYYSFLDVEGQTVEEGRYIIIFRQIDGEWKVQYDLFNSSRPLPEM